MRAALLVALLLAPRAAGAVGEKIVAIDVVGNSKTSDETVRLIAAVGVGDKLTDGLVDRVKVDLQTSGLFKEVDVTVRPVSAARVRLRIRARDKHSWVIAPTFYTQPGNIGGGLAFGENNLFGHNKKLLLYGQIATADSLFLAGYLDPALGGTRFYWRVETLLRHSLVTEYDSPTGYLAQPAPMRESTMNYLNGGLLLGLNLWRGWSLDAKIRGGYVYFRDARWAEGVDTATLPETPPRPSADGWDVSGEWRLTRDGRANWNGVTDGTVVQVGFERSLTALGSDFDYWSLEGKAQLYKKIFSTHNLALKMGAAGGWHLPFQNEYTAGGTGLRGYKNAQFRGDFKVATTVEYSLQLFWIGSFALRALGFWDTAYTAFLMDDGNPMRHYLPGQTEENLNRWRNGVGGGLRVVARSVVLPLLGVDVGYGIEARDVQIYLAVGLTEL
jgi:outer membrane protein assembly factor BamA